MRGHNFHGAVRKRRPAVTPEIIREITIGSHITFDARTPGRILRRGESGHVIAIILSQRGQLLAFIVSAERRRKFKNHVVTPDRVERLWKEKQ